MNSFKHFKPKTSKLYNRKNTIRSLLNADGDDFTTEKKVILKGEEYTPWSMYVCEKTTALEDYPEYSYLEFSLYIYDTILDPIYYSEIFHILRLAKPGDLMHIYINSPGGDINTLCSFSAAIAESEAFIATHIDGSADSAAFVLAFMGDETFFSEFSQMMSHNVSMSTSRMDMANIEKYAKITKETYRGMLEKYCNKVLTSEEITNICENGMEIHLSSKECEERITKWYEEHKEELKEENHACSCEKCSCEENDEKEESLNVFDSVVALGNTIQKPLHIGAKQK